MKPLPSTGAKALRRRRSRSFGAWENRVRVNRGIVAGIYYRQETIILRVCGFVPPSEVRALVAAGLGYAFEQGYCTPTAVRSLHCLKAKQRSLVTSDRTVCAQCPLSPALGKVIPPHAYRDAKTHWPSECKDPDTFGSSAEWARA